MTHLKHEDYDAAFRTAALVRDTILLPPPHFWLTQLCLKELLQNAFQHAESAPGIYVCAYGIKNRSLVRICTLDRGQGIRRHLTKNPKYAAIATDSEALELATERDVSGEPKESRGLGLFLVKRLLQDIGGEMVIASGDSMMSVKPPHEPTFKRLDPEFRGTIVSIKFHAKRGYRFRLDDYEG